MPRSRLFLCDLIINAILQTLRRRDQILITLRTLNHQGRWPAQSQTRFVPTRMRDAWNWPLRLCRPCKLAFPPSKLQSWWGPHEGEWAASATEWFCLAFLDFGVSSVIPHVSVTTIHKTNTSYLDQFFYARLSFVQWQACLLPHVPSKSRLCNGVWDSVRVACNFVRRVTLSIKAREFHIAPSLRVTLACIINHSFEWPDAQLKQWNIFAQQFTEWAQQSKLCGRRQKRQRTENTKWLLFSFETL